MYRKCKIPSGFQGLGPKNETLCENYVMKHSSCLLQVGTVFLMQWVKEDIIKINFPGFFLKKMASRKFKRFACFMFLWGWVTLGLEVCPCHQGNIL